MLRKLNICISAVVLLCLLVALFISGLEFGHQLIHHCTEEYCRECSLILIVGQITRSLVQGPEVMVHHFALPTVAALAAILLWSFLRTSAVDEKVRLNC